MGLDEPTADERPAAYRSLASAREDPRIGTTVAGRYRVLGRLGEGGFGLVYEAEQTEPVARRVALKILKPGMDSKAVLARFEAERQALALMDHAGIARILDAGETERGVPFFAMELVRGTPITEFCDRHRLNVEARLRLFAGVCDAIQHAHTKAVIHRDIKPSNVLVEAGEGEDPVPKVIDFGIAKAVAQRLTERTLFTERGEMIGTPEYMSPEQAEMGTEGIDTRSDVYSLGVLLYELLTGERPFDLRQAALGEVQRVIREVDPPKPSTRLTAHADAASTIAERRRTDTRSLVNALRRELEWIPLKALRKERNERYRSAADLADDARRFLADEALEAGPPSVAYQLRKLARRHRWPVAAVTGTLAALLLGLVGTAYGLARASREAERANGEAATARLAESEQRRLAEDARRDRDVAAHATRTSERTAYVANVQLASLSLRDLRWGRVEALLDACPPRLRGWEWHFVRSSFDNCIREFPHAGPTSAIAISPDGERVVTADRDGVAHLWDVSLDAPLFELGEADDGLRSLSFSRDGTRIAAVSTDGIVSIWSATDGKRLIRLGEQARPAWSVAFSPDGSMLLTRGAESTARVWDLSTQRPLLTRDTRHGAIEAIAFDLDSERLLVATRAGVARVWNIASGAIHSEFEYADDVETAVFSPDRSRLAVESQGGAVRVWDVTTGQPVIRLGRGEDSRDSDRMAVSSLQKSIAFTPSGSGIVFRHGWIWSILRFDEPIERLGNWEYPERDIGQLSLTPDGSRVITLLEDGTLHVARLPVRPFDHESEFALTGSVGALGVRMVSSADGTHVLTSAEDDVARLWRTDLLAAQSSDSYRFGHLAALSADGSTLVSVVGAGTVRVHDLGTGSIRTEWREEDATLHSIAISPDGTRVAIGAGRAGAWVRDTATGDRIATLDAEGHHVYDVSFTRDASSVATTSFQSGVRVWDSSSGRVLLDAPHDENVFERALWPDGGQFLTISSLRGRVVRLWRRSPDTTTPDAVTITSGARELALSPDATVIAIAMDERIDLWDTTRWEKVGDLIGHRDWIHDIAFSSDGTRIASTSIDGTLRIWDVVTRRPVATSIAQKGESAVEVRFTAGDTRIVTVSERGLTSIWDAETAAFLVELGDGTGRGGRVSITTDGTRILTYGIDGSRLWDAVPDRIRRAECEANRRGEDGGAIVRAWLREVGLAAPSP